MLNNCEQNRYNAESKEHKELMTQENQTGKKPGEDLTYLFSR